MGKKIYYKVVNKYLESAIIGNSMWHNILVPEAKKMIVKYKIGEFVSPNINGTSLMVFDNIGLATTFAKEMNRGCTQGVLLFTCHIDRGRRYGVFANVIFRSVSWWDEIQRQLRLKRNHKKYIDRAKFEEPPFGTIFANRVKLLRVIPL